MKLLTTVHFCFWKGVAWIFVHANLKKRQQIERSGEDTGCKTYTGRGAQQYQKPIKSNGTVLKKSIVFAAYSYPPWGKGDL